MACPTHKTSGRSRVPIFGKIKSELGWPISREKIEPTHNVHTLSVVYVDYESYDRVFLILILTATVSFK